MSSKLPGLASSRYVIPLRIVIIIFGCISVTWGLMTFPVFRQQASIELTASQIISGEIFKVETLMGQMPIVEAAEKSAHCRPRALWSAAIIRLRIIDKADHLAGELVQRLPGLIRLREARRNRIVRERVA